MNSTSVDYNTFSSIDNNSYKCGANKIFNDEKKSQKTSEETFLNKKLFFTNNESSKVHPDPLSSFKNMLRNNYFTKEYQCFLNKLKLESFEDYTNSYKNSYSHIKSNLESFYNNFYKNPEKSESEGELDNDLFGDFASFDTNPEIPSSGYTTVLSDDDNENSKDNNFNSNSKDNRNLNCELNNNNFKNSNINTRIGEESFKNKNNSNCGKNGKMSQSNPACNIIYSSSLNNEASCHSTDRLKNLKINKNQLTIRPRSKEEIKDFQRQELERYKKPHLPWKFNHPDGTSTVVAPVQKKIPTIGQTKPRDHVLLKADRPSYVTILCLARDAAARLPEGVGTRADICDLIKDSQFTNERLSDTQINNIVSGALDRLHYEKDPCVKYDLQRKLWIYLHKERTLEYEPWNEHLRKNGLNSTGEPLGKNYNKTNKNFIYALISTK